MNLNGEYIGIVVSDKTDPLKKGSVQVRVLGVMDNIPEKFLPFAEPEFSTTTYVPLKGYKVKIKFKNGDLHNPVWYKSSADKKSLPSNFKNGYPNVVYHTFSDDSFSMYHDRVELLTQIEHPSESRIIWDAFGKITVQSDNSHSISHRKTGISDTEHHVLTEATIDIFTCSPFGNALTSGGSRQGSEFLKTTHMSKTTYDRLQGTNSSTVLPISNINKKLTDTLSSGRTYNKNLLDIGLGSIKKVKYIVIYHSDAETYDQKLESMKSFNSSHFIIDGVDIYQTLDLKLIGSTGYGIKYLTDDISNTSISICLIGSDNSNFDGNKQIITDVIQHVKGVYPSAKILKSTDKLLSIPINLTLNLEL